MAQPDQFDGLELRSFNWQVQPLVVDKVESSFFDNRALFPAGSVEFDCALLMQGIEHEWHGRGRLCAGCEQTQETANPSNAHPAIASLVQDSGSRFNQSSRQS